MDTNDKEIASKGMDTISNILNGQNAVLNGSQPSYFSFVFMIGVMALMNLLMFGLAAFSVYYATTQIQEIKSNIVQISSNIELIKKNTYVTRLKSEQGLDTSGLRRAGE